MFEERFTAQLLAGPPAADPESVARRLLAIQAQDARGARLAIRARTTGLTAADVDRALTVGRTLVITWLCRGTLHLVRSEDYPWLHALTTPQLFTANARRLAQEGVSAGAADRAVAVIVRSLADAGPLTRTQLGERIAAAGVRTEGQALVHLLMLACLRGHAVRGPMIARQQAYVLVRDWLGEPAAVERERALAELARRYLDGHGPADERDLARWAGITLRDARAALGAIASELRTRADGLVEPAAGDRVPGPPPVRLLGPFDPALLGWRSREWILGPYDSKVVGGGLFRAVALAGGGAIATWALRDGEVVLEPLLRLRREHAGPLAAEAADVVRFLAGGE
jgi:Winged helix DNA-binding domain